MVAAVIADMVGSRRFADRSAAQRTFERVLAEVERETPLAAAPLRATVGDEFQGVYPTLDAALIALLLIQLALPDEHQLRFGVGIGRVSAVEGSAASLQDGPGWWAAREAIELVDAQQRRALPTSRTWVVRSPQIADSPLRNIGHSEEDRRMTAADVDTANAYLLVRDQLVGAMTERERRLTYGRCLGRTQLALAEDEGITQSAVSQALQSAGAAAIIAGFELLRKRAA